MAPSAVLLVAHGSARSGASAEPVLDLARALRARGIDEVRTAFWKEEPFLHQALDTVRSADVLVLPVFLAEGYFSRTVVPRELGVEYGLWTGRGRSVRLLPPLAVAPALDELVVARAEESGGRDLSDALLVVLGHGTPRDPGSAHAVLGVCARLAASGRFGRVAPAFIDQEPGVEEVISTAREPRVVVVPFLVASGWHGGALGSESGRHARPVVYAEPVGTHPRLADVALALVRGALADAPVRTAPTAETPCALALHALTERLERARALNLLEVDIRAVGAHEFELRHTADAAAAPTTLLELLDADALERRARRTADGRHRPLRTGADLAPGWRHVARGASGLGDALVALYGPALTHWYLGESGTIAPTSFTAAASRQTGMYARLAGVEPAAVEVGIARVCDGCPCLRRRLWTIGDERVSAPAAERSTDAAAAASAALVVPCAAPCPVLLTAVLDAL